MVPGRQLQALEFKKKNVITENDIKHAKLLLVNEHSGGKVIRARSSTQLLKINGTGIGKIYQYIWYAENNNMKGLSNYEQIAIRILKQLYLGSVTVGRPIRQRFCPPYMNQRV
jgi:hypothetical protein